jgi:hypothetical protein
MMIVEARVIRGKAPVPPEPQVIREREEMLAELRGVRERTLALMRHMKQMREIAGTLPKTVTSLQK